MTERRTLLKVLAGGGGAVAAGAAVLPSVGVIAAGAPVTAGGGWTRVARMEALEAGRAFRANVIGAEVDAWLRAPDRPLGAVWLFREGEQGVKAFSAVCPHLGCAVELAENAFVCRCHDSFFGLGGERRTGPSPRGLDPLEARVEDGWVLVRWKRFRMGVPERVEG